MANLKALLAKTDEESRESEAALEREYLELGEELLEGGLGGSSSTDLKDLHTRARESRELLTAAEEAKDRLARLITQAQEIRDNVEEKKRELAALEEEIEPHYEKVGRAAAEALEDDEEAAEPYRSLIDQLDALEQEIKQLDRDRARSEQRDEDKGLLTQALEGGKRLYFQGLSKSKGVRVTSLYRRLGREACENDLVTKLDSHAFDEVLEPVLKNKEQSDKVRAQMTALTSRAERVEQEIDGFCENERPQRTLQRLERDHEKAHEVLDVQLRDLGAQYVDRVRDKQGVAKSVAGRMDRITTVRKALQGLTKKRERIEAAMAIEELERKVEGSRSRVRSLSTTAKKLNREIEELNAQIKELSAERERLLKVRGSLDDLTSDEKEEE